MQFCSQMLWMALAIWAPGKLWKLNVLKLHYASSCKEIIGWFNYYYYYHHFYRYHYYFIVIIIIIIIIIIFIMIIFYIIVNISIKRRGQQLVFLPSKKIVPFHDINTSS